MDLIEGLMPYIETMKLIIIHNGENDQSLLDTFLNIILLKNKLFNSKIKCNKCFKILYHKY